MNYRILGKTNFSVSKVSQIDSYLSSVALPPLSVEERVAVRKVYKAGGASGVIVSILLLIKVFT